MDIEEEKSSKIILAFVAASFGIVLALPIIAFLYEVLTPFHILIIFILSCSLSFIINHFFPNLYCRILNIFHHISF